MKIQESGENYLETILRLREAKGYVRAVDVASELGFSKPSVSRALGILKNAGLVEIESSGNILLTDEGRQRAAAIYERHQTITRFLVQTLNVPQETASADACRIEHVISGVTFERIKDYVADNRDNRTNSISTPLPKHLL